MATLLQTASITIEIIRDPLSTTKEARDGYLKVTDECFLRSAVFDNTGFDGTLQYPLNEQQQLLSFGDNRDFLARWAHRIETSAEWEKVVAILHKFA